jgi:hypothetical protein
MITAGWTMFATSYVLLLFNRSQQQQVWQGDLKTYIFSNFPPKHEVLQYTQNK